MMKSKPYSIAIDGSNDNGLGKMYPLTVGAFSDQGIVVQLLDMCILEGSTAELIFSAVNNILETLQIPMDQYVGFTFDNTSVNVGKHNSIMTRAKEKNSNHLFHLLDAHVILFIILLVRLLKSIVKKQNLMLKISVQIAFIGLTNPQTEN